MADIKISIGIDTAELTQGLKAATQTAGQEAQAIGKELGNSVNEGAKTAKTGLSSLVSTFGDLKEKAASAADGIKQGFSGAFSGGLLGGLLGGGIAGAVQTGIGLITEGFSAAIDAGSEFESSLAMLSSITGVAGDDLAKFGDKAKELAAQYGGEAKTQIESFQTILSKFGPGLAKTPEALNSVTESVNILAQASGLDAKASVDALANSLLQFGVDAKDPAKLAQEAGRFINVLAAGAKEGAAEVPQMTEAILQAGVAAKGLNISFEETNAAIQQLAVGGKTGSEAGVALRNVLNLMVKPSGEAEKALKSVGLSSKELGELITTKGVAAALDRYNQGLGKLGTAAEKAAFNAQIFGAENASAAGILLGGVEGIKSLTTAITGTRTAYEQAEVNAATFAAGISRLKAQIQNFAIDVFQGAQTALKFLFSAIGPALTEAGSAIKSAFQEISNAIKPILAVIGGAIFTGIVVTVQTAAQLVRVAFTVIAEVFNSVLAALAPVGKAFSDLFGGGLSKNISVVKLASDVFSGLGNVLKFVGDVLIDLGRFIGDVVAAPIKLLVSQFQGLIENLSQFTIVKNIFAALGSVFQSASGTAGGLADKLNSLRSVGAGVGSVFSALVDVVGNFIKNLASFNLSAALQSFSGLGGKIADAYQKGYADKITEIRGKQAEEAKQQAAETAKADDAAAKLSAGAAQQAEKKSKDALTKAKENFTDFRALQETELKKFQISLAGLSADEAKAAISAKRKEQAEQAIQELNRIFTGQNVAGLLDANIKIKPNKENTVADIRKTYVDFYFQAFKDLEIPAPKLAKEKAAEETKAQIIDLELLEIRSIENVAERKYRLALLTNQRQKAAELASAAGDIDKQATITAKFAVERAKIEEDYRAQNDLGFAASLALQKSLQDNFNAATIQAARATANAEREAKLAALKTQEQDLEKSLASQQISVSEYLVKLGELQEERRKAEQQGESLLGANLETLRKTAGDAIGQVLQQQGKKFNDLAAASAAKELDIQQRQADARKRFEALKGKETTDEYKAAQAELNKANTEAANQEAGIFGLRQSVLEGFAGNALATFSQLAASGKATLADFGKATVQIAFDALQNQIPVFIAQIFGQTVASLGPIAGPIVSGVLTATLYGLVSAARGALGFKDGVVNLQGPGTETSDSIPAWLSRGESVVNAAATKQNIEVLTWMNKTGRPVSEYREFYNPPNQDNGMIYNELAKMNTNIERLGKTFSRNTSVNVSGTLRADGRTIEAALVAERKSNYLRG